MAMGLYFIATGKHHFSKNNKHHEWKPRVAMIPISSSLVVPQVIVTATWCATSDGRKKNWHHGNFSIVLFIPNDYPNGSSLLCCILLWLVTNRLQDSLTGTGSFIGFCQSNDMYVNMLYEVCFVYLAITKQRTESALTFLGIHFKIVEYWVAMRKTQYLSFITFVILIFYHYSTAQIVYNQSNEKSSLLPSLYFIS